MRKLVAFTAVWLAAAAVAVVVAWQGVGIVTNQVTDDRPAPLAAGEVRALTAEAQQAGGPSTTLAPTVEPTGPGGTTDTTPPAPTTTAPASPATTAPPAPAETRTYNVVGGSVSLRFSSSGVTVVWATPAAGFEVEVEPEHGHGVRVEFESDGHRSRVTGWWDGGPRDETREEER